MIQDTSIEKFIWQIFKSYHIVQLLLFLKLNEIITWIQINEWQITTWRSVYIFYLKKSK